MIEKMNITSAQYAKINGVLLGVNATINGKECSVPIDMNNRHYVEILRQVKEEGLVIQEASE